MKSFFTLPSPEGGKLQLSVEGCRPYRYVVTLFNSQGTIRGSRGFRLSGIRRLSKYLSAAVSLEEEQLKRATSKSEGSASACEPVPTDS
jgi:hypothetical protein